MKQSKYNLSMDIWGPIPSFSCNISIKDLQWLDIIVLKDQTEPLLSNLVYTMLAIYLLLVYVMWMDGKQAIMYKDQLANIINGCCNLL